ncbi:MAG: ATP-binding protein [Bacteroidota bacterium]
MDIENRRFGVPFEYSITVGDQLNTFDTVVPTMLIQPFVENAIKHGIFHKKERGSIVISFFSENTNLKCVIEDNGIGRQKSNALNQQSGRHHQSRGLEIVNDRLDIMRKNNQGDFKFNIIDLVDLNQHPTGTRVEITLPR